MRAHFETLNEPVLMAPADSRYTQVVFNLVSVQVCKEKLVKGQNNGRKIAEPHRKYYSKTIKSVIDWSSENMAINCEL